MKMMIMMSWLAVMMRHQFIELLSNSSSSAGYKVTTAGKFTEALRLFMVILPTIPLIVVESRREVDEVKGLVIIVKEYVLGFLMELKGREVKDNHVPQLELAAYFTHCNLQPPHLILDLMNDMSLCFKAGNLITTSNFARRLLEANPVESHCQEARSVIQAAERNMRDSTQLNYDFRILFVICGGNLRSYISGTEGCFVSLLQFTFCYFPGCTDL